MFLARSRTVWQESREGSDGKVEITEVLFLKAVVEKKIEANWWLVRGYTFCTAKDTCLKTRK